MGRPGGGSSHSSGGHSSSHRSGGHHVGGSRPRGGGFSSSHSSYGSHSSNLGGYRSSSSGTNFGRGHDHDTYGGNSSSGDGYSIISGIIIALVVIFIVMGLISQETGSGSTDTSNTTKISSTRERQELKVASEFDINCIYDEEGWITSKDTVYTGLEYFFYKTGVQPYIAILSYNAEYASDVQREEYANQMYNQLFSDEYHFLYVYFAESDPKDVGYMCYVSGKQADSVMDDEAIEIFWSNIDKYYYSNCTEDEMFANAFTDTAREIMKNIITGNDILFIILVIIMIGVVGYFSITMFQKVRKAQKEKAEETQRILNTPVEPIKDEKLTELENKYQ